MTGIIEGTVIEGTVAGGVFEGERSVRVLVVGDECDFERRDSVLICQSSTPA
jgi:hypothetical protein